MFLALTDPKTGEPVEIIQRLCFDKNSARGFEAQFGVSAKDPGCTDVAGLQNPRGPTILTGTMCICDSNLCNLASPRKPPNFGMLLGAIAALAIMTFA